MSQCIKYLYQYSCNSLISYYSAFQHTFCLSPRFVYKDNREIVNCVFQTRLKLDLFWHYVYVFPVTCYLLKVCEISTSIITCRANATLPVSVLFAVMHVIVIASLGSIR